MADSNISDNPFAALFGSVQQAEAFSSTNKVPGTETLPSIIQEVPKQDVQQQPEENVTQSVAKTNNIIEKSFLITLDQEPFSDRPHRCVYLEELKDVLDGQEWLDASCLEQAVFERLMLAEPASHVITTNSPAPNPLAASEASETDTLRYLYASYKRLQQLNEVTQPGMEGVSRKCLEVILMNARTCFQHPEVFASETPGKQFLDLFLDDTTTADADHVQCFFELVATEIDKHQDEGTVEESFSAALNLIQEKLKEFSLGHGVLYNYLDLLLFFSRTECLAKALIRFSTPRDLNTGRAYETTLFGSVLAVSSIVKNENGPYDFFNSPSRYTKKEHDITEQSIHQPIGLLNDKMHALFKNLLKAGAQSKTMLLDWLGNCMHANKGRAKLWSRQMMPMLFHQTYCSEGFFLNLCAVLLRLCQPFSEPCNPKLLKVQPTYCLATVGEKEQVKNRNVHLRDVSDTGLIPPQEGAENEEPIPESHYNFLSECFFLGHYCLHLGFHPAHERFMKLNQDLHRVQGAYNDIVAQGAQNSEPGTRMKEQMEKGMTVFLCLKAALTEPRLLEQCLDFHVATTTYLVHMATSCNHTAFEPVKFPLSDRGPPVLTCIPEFVAENILDFMLFVRRFKDTLYETVSSDKLEHLMTFILVFMGSPQFMRNPHLRARMAEALEAIMPPKAGQSNSLGMSHFQREQLFHTHPLALQLAPTLMHVFVSIEMTGQGVEFEQKFNYRRPMYSILEYLWGVTKHQDSIKELACYAEDHIADVTAPLFLRFVNLLINDAIFLLDEALSYMQQIKEKQQEREGEAWSNLEPRQRQEAESNFRHLTMLARFHNIMGNDTIKTLEMITTTIKSLFYDPVLVDRIASMLNYFLLHLVGPKKKNLKVKDFDQFEFRPDRTVSHISQIYLQLGVGEEFQRAVARDGRSYSPALFEQAQAVLVKIHRPMESIVQFQELAGQIREFAQQQMEEDDVLNYAPEEFLDPIMGTFMRDPVLLPSSGQIVDRPTIARHILSDQFDPFNRQPLTMNMVEPDVELKSRIEAWLLEWRKQREEKKNSEVSNVKTPAESVVGTEEEMQS